MRHLLLLVALALWVAPTQGQHIFADTNGDGISTSVDQLSKSGATTIDVWLETDRNRDGSAPTRMADPQPLSFFSYEFVPMRSGGR